MGDQMDSEPRRAVVTALVELGRSRDFRDRADAGHGLAAFADVQEARRPLLELVLDQADTMVTLVTAEALLRRQDKAGLSVLASAWEAAEGQQRGWIHTAIDDVLGIFSEDRDKAMRLCEELMQDDAADGTARRARRLHEILVGLDPVLRPA